MKILGIDPGIGRCGWAVLETQNTKLNLLNCGCIETKTNGEIAQRLKVLFENLNEIIKKYKPEILAIEDLFFNKNAKTNLMVGEARGIILLTAALNNIPVISYTPLQVKIALTGYGRAEKSQVGFMVKNILKLEKLPKPDDTVDAIAIAITQGFSKKKF